MQVYVSRLRSGTRAQRVVAAIWVLALAGVCGYALFRVGATALMPYPFTSFFGLEPSYSDPWDAGHLIRLVIPPLFAFIFLAWNLLERVSFDETGIRLSLGPIDLALARWASIKKVILLSHRNQSPTVVLHYSTAFGLPMKLALHARRYAGGRRLIERIMADAAAREIDVQRVSVSPSRLYFGWGLIIAGLLCAAAEPMLAIVTLDRYDAMQSSYLHWIPWPMGAFTALQLGLAGLVSAGFGCLSVYHLGSPRPILLIMWLSALMNTSGIFILWLVNIASYAIWAATLQPVANYHVSSAYYPNQTLMLLATDFATIVVAALCYYIACYWAIHGNRIRSVLAPKLAPVLILRTVFKPKPPIVSGSSEWRFGRAERPI